MNLVDQIDPLAYDIAFWVDCLDDPDYPDDELGDLSIDLSTKLRVLAISLLLTNGDPDAFFHHLIRSANHRIRYLQRIRAAGITDDHHQGASRVDALHDALAAGRFDLAHQIGDLASDTFLAGHEYLDDFHYGRAVWRSSASLVDVAPLEAEIDAFEAALNGRTDARVAVLRAIARRDQPGFDAAFDALIDERSLAIDTAKAQGQLLTPAVFTRRQTYVEGLALLRLAAQRAGLVTLPDYQYCPSLARVPMVKPFPGE